MAGDWLKVRMDLHEDPAVIGIAARLEITEDEVVGKLVRLWAWANRQTRDGNAGVTPMFVDRYVGATGFAVAMAQVGWLQIEEDRILFPNYDRHNGASAKARALCGERVAAHRASKRNASSVTKPLPEKRREEKRRENPLTPFPESLSSEAFAEAWERWRTHRREIRHTLKPTTERAQLKKLAAMGEARAIAAITHSIENGYQGLFEPSPKDNTRNGTSTDTLRDRAAAALRERGLE